MAYMAPSPSRQAGASSTSGNSDGQASSRGHAGTTRGALSGVMGASPFGVLATTPELPTSTLVLGPTSSSPRPLLPTSESSARRPGLSLRRANSNSASGGPGSRASAGGTHSAPVGRRGGFMTLKRAGIVLLLLQLALGWLVFVHRPAWLAGVTGLVRSAPAAIFSSHRAAAPTRTAHASDGDGNGDGAAARTTTKAGAHVAALTSSRKERVGTTLNDLAHRAGVSTEVPAAANGAATTPTKSTSTTAQTSHHISNKVTQHSVRLQPTAAAAIDSKKANGANAAAATAAAAAAVAAAAAGTAVAAKSLKGTQHAAYPPFTVPVVPYTNRVSSPPRITGVVFYGRWVLAWRVGLGLGLGWGWGWGWVEMDRARAVPAGGRGRAEGAVRLGIGTGCSHERCGLNRKGMRDKRKLRRGDGVGAGCGLRVRSWASPCW